MKELWIRTVCDPVRVVTGVHPERSTGFVRLKWKERENMACFIVPAAEAVVTAAASHAVKKMEKESAEAHTDNVEKVIREKKIPFSRKLGWLTKLLAGGSILLAFASARRKSRLSFA